jgi:UTP--glucose-1-phosphate uridylyltransferase
MIRKVVVPAAGLGTRLLPITKELPKEMLPVFFKGKGGRVCLKPMLQAVYEQLYDSGFREFVFIGGRGKRAIEDHFSPDDSFIEYLRNKNKDDLVEELQKFYKKINNSTIVFVNQPKPNGLGDAVYRAMIFTGDDPFLVHAGDDLILSRNNDHLKRIMNVFEHYDADAVFLVEEVKDPRRYGVIIGDEIKPDIFEVKKVVEKPRTPPSNLAVIALYVFKPIIYRAIEKVEPDKDGEVQLTDAISFLLDWRCRVYALKLRLGERRIDIGTPENYLEILKTMIQNS